MVHKKIPIKGDVKVFNRSYYEDVLVTRVHKTIDDVIAFRRFNEINEFEKYLVNNNTIILKFFLHISKEFQQEKLEIRLKSPEKHWEFFAADLNEREFWDYIVLKTIVKTMVDLKLEYPSLDGNVKELINKVKDSK